MASSSYRRKQRLSKNWLMEKFKTSWANYAGTSHVSKSVLCLAYRTRTPHSWDVTLILLDCLHFGIDSMNSITMYIGLSVLKLLHAIRLGFSKPRDSVCLGIRCTELKIQFIDFFLILFEFLFIVYLSIYNKLCWIHQMYLKSIGITINYINHTQDTFENVGWNFRRDPICILPG